MFFLGTERAFHRCGSHSGKFPLGSILHLVLACPAFLGEGGLDSALLAERSVIVSRVWDAIGKLDSNWLFVTDMEAGRRSIEDSLLINSYCHMCSSRNRNTYGITTSSFSPPTNEAIPLRLALLNPWLAPWIGYRTADGYFSTACSEYLMSTMKSLVPCWDGWK